MEQTVYGGYRWNQQSSQEILYSPLWSPADHGSSDNRTLGVSIDKIIFEKQE